MNITKNWFYKISNQTKEIFVWNNLVICIFDSENILKKITIWKNSKVEYFSFFYKQSFFKKHILLSWNDSYCEINSLIFSKNNQINCEIIWEINSSNSKINMQITSFAKNNWDIKINWTLKINENTKKNSWFLKKENIFLWKNAKIFSSPVLLIKTNDVKVGHSCKVEKVSDRDLFYIMSRWISRERSVYMIMQAKIINLFKYLHTVDSKFHDKLIENILEKIFCKNIKKTI